MRGYRQPNQSLAVDIEQDAVFFGMAALLVGVGVYLIWQKATSAGANALAAVHDALNETMGGEIPMGSDVAPGSPEEPENYVGYE
jgi:hypothetical protein